MTSYPSRRSSIAMDRATPGSSSMCSKRAPLGGVMAITCSIDASSAGSAVISPRGAWMVNVVPLPTRDSMAIVWSSSRQIVCTIDRPRPTPRCRS